jgi:hypothetical protein
MRAPRGVGHRTPAAGARARLSAHRCGRSTSTSSPTAPIDRCVSNRTSRISCVGCSELADALQERKLIGARISVHPRFPLKRACASGLVKGAEVTVGCPHSPLAHVARLRSEPDRARSATVGRMQRPSPPLVRGLELRPTAARLVARAGTVVDIVAPGRPRAATGWRWWTLVASGVAMSLATALARIAELITSPDGEDTTRDAGAQQLNRVPTTRPLRRPTP